MANVLNYILLIYLWGSVIGFALVTYKMIEMLVMPALIVWLDLEQQSAVTLFQLGIVFILASIALPFTWKNQLSKTFTMISNVSVVFILYMIILLSVQCVSYKKNFEHKHFPMYSMFKWNVIDMLKYFGNFLYGLNCSASLFTMTSQLKKNRHSAHIRKIYIFTALFLYLIFSIAGIIGYIGLGNDSAEYDLIIFRPPLPGSKDIPMKVGLLCVGLTNLVCFTLYAVSWKIQFLGFFKFEMTTRKNILISLLVVYLPFIIGWSYPYATKIFGIIGAFFGTILATTFPGMFYLVYLAQTERKWGKKFWAMLVWCSASTLLGFISGTVLIIDLF